MKLKLAYVAGGYQLGRKIRRHGCVVYVRFVPEANITTAFSRADPRERRRQILGGWPDLERSPFPGTNEQRRDYGGLSRLCSCCMPGQRRHSAPRPTVDRRFAKDSVKKRAAECKRWASRDRAPIPRAGTPDQAL
jgi:hypothetical protein